MLSRKNKNADLEKKRNLFLLLGLVIVLSFIYAGFELYASSDSQKPVPVFEDDFFTYIENTKSTDQNVQKVKKDPIKEQVLKTVKTNLLNNKTEFINWGLIDVDPITLDTAEIPIITPIIDDFIIKEYVNHMPQFPGGEEAFKKFLKSELRYPEEARAIGIEGTVLVQFVVEKDGRVSQPKVLISIYPALDDEALRVISKSPKWIPGEHFGNKARVYLQMPIQFQLN